MKKVLFLFLFFAPMIFGQGITVTDQKKIDLSEEMFHAKFFPNGEKLLFTSSSYKGLYAYDPATENLTVINDYVSSGYENIFIEDGAKIVFRKDDFINKRKYSSLISYDLQNRDELLLEKSIRNLSVPELLPDGKIFYTTDSAPKLKEVSSNQSSDAVENGETIVYQENAKIIVYNGTKNMILPFGDGHYLWTELSPSQDMILFTYAGKGTFICDLEGNILYEIGYANSPKWSPDGKYVVYMKDYDDGHRVTKSDIFVYSLNSGSEVNITNTPGTIELYPSWSPKGDKLVFNDNKGDLYIVTLNIE